MAIQGTHGSTTNLGAPFIDGLTTARAMHEALIPNVVQSLLHSNGHGITDRYSTQIIGVDEIRVVMGKPLEQRFRTLGSGEDNNSYSFNQKDPEQPKTQHYGIKLRHVIDGAVDLAQVSMDMVPLDYANDTAEKIYQLMVKMINASTIATQLAAVFNYDFERTENGEDSLFVQYDDAEDSMLDKFIEANLVLHDGAPDHFIDTFDPQGRVAFLNTKGLRELKTVEKAVVDMGNTTGQELLRIGSLGGTEVRANTRLDGFQGMIDQIPVHFVSKPIWSVVEDILGLERGKLDGIYAMISAHEATARGIDFTRGVQVDTHPKGQGIRFKPLYRWGVQVFFPEGIALLVDNDFSNPVTLEEEKLEVIGTDTTIE